jgi:hypothetical protein
MADKKRFPLKGCPANTKTPASDIRAGVSASNRCASAQRRRPRRSSLSVSSQLGTLFQPITDEEPPMATKKVARNLPPRRR